VTFSEIFGQIVIRRRLPSHEKKLVENHKSSTRVVFLSAIIVAPFFLKVTGSSIELGDPVVATGVGQTLPISVFAVALFLGTSTATILLKNRIRWRRSPLNIPILLFVFLNLFALLVGLSHEARVENLLFCLQTIAPFLSFFIALNAVESIAAVQGIFVACIWIIGGFVLFLAALTTIVIGFGAPTEVYEYLVTLPVYQLFDYIPLVVAAVYGLGLALLLGGAPTKRKWILFGFVMVMLFSIFMLRSRGALVTMVVITLIQFVLFARSHGSTKGIAIFSVASGSMIILLLLGPETLTLENVRYFLEEKGDDQSLIERQFNMSLAVETISRNPLIGQAYVTGGENALNQRTIANPHNQYLTYAVRGGIISMLVYVWILVLFLKRIFLLLVKASTALMRTFGIALFSVFLGVSLVSNMLQDNFTQPYSGFLLCFLMGVGEFLCNQRAGGTKQVPTSTQKGPQAA